MFRMVKNNSLRIQRWIPSISVGCRKDAVMLEECCTVRSMTTERASLISSAHESTDKDKGNWKQSIGRL
jgi:hypothetical protein